MDRIVALLIAVFIVVSVLYVCKNRFKLSIAISSFLSLVFAIAFMYMPVEFAVDEAKYSSVDDCIAVKFAVGTGVEWENCNTKEYVHLVGDTPFKYGFGFLYGKSNRFICSSTLIGMGYLGKMDEYFGERYPVYDVEKSYIVKPIDRDYWFMPRSYICILDIILREDIDSVGVTV